MHSKKIPLLFFFIGYLILGNADSSSLGLAIDGKSVFGNEVLNAGGLGNNDAQGVMPFANIGPGDLGWLDADNDFIHDACDNDPSNHKDRNNLCTGIDEGSAALNMDPTGSCKLVTYPESKINHDNEGQGCGTGWHLSSSGSTFGRCANLIPRGVVHTAGKKTYGIQFTNMTIGTQWFRAGWADKGHQWTLNNVAWYMRGGSSSRTKNIYTNRRLTPTFSDTWANVCIKD